MEETYYTIDDIARKLEVHTKTVRRYIYNGKIQAFKVGGQWRVYQSALDEYFTRSKHCVDNEESSKDDFCVFMDGQNRTYLEKLQICTIADYYVDKQEEAKPIVNEVTDSIMSFEEDEEYKFNYMYDRAEKRVRLVLWGNASFISEVLQRLKKYE